MFGAITIQLAQLLTATQLAQAKPAPEVLSRIEQSYSPIVAIQATPSGRSLYGCELHDLVLTAKDPVTGALGATNARIYNPPFDTESRALRAVVLLPPTGGENTLDRGYANTLCLSGFKVVLLQSWAHDTDVDLDLGMHDRGALRALTAVRRIVDYLNPEHSKQIGIMGTSVGALSSALALGFDSRLSSAALIVGGVGMAEIIATTTEAGAAKLREARMQKLGFKSAADYLTALRTQVTIDPKDFADFSGPKKVLAFVGTEDVTVPTKNQHDLVRAFQAESQEYAGDHTATILHTFALKQSAIVDFFEANLAVGAIR
jgi:dienelactone hydrolase